MWSGAGGVKGPSDRWRWRGEEASGSVVEAARFRLGEAGARGGGGRGAPSAGEVSWFCATEVEAVDIAANRVGGEEVGVVPAGSVSVAKATESADALTVAVDGRACTEGGI